MSAKTKALGSFIESAPPGELTNVTAAIKAIVGDDAINDLEPAFERYNEEQFATVKLPGGSQAVVISPYNKLPDGRYYDVESSTSFAFDHVAQKASAAQSYTLESGNAELIKSLLKAFTTYAGEHYPSCSLTVCPADADSIALVLVANKYSPQNFWNGRYRSSYLYTPSSGSLTGVIKADVHYYENSNVRLLVEKKVDVRAGQGGAGEVVSAIAAAERRHQLEMNRAFVSTSEGAFKSLRRQLPVTRQKVDWEKIGGYKIGKSLEGVR